MNNTFYVNSYRREGLCDSEAIRLCLMDAEAVSPRTVVFDGADYHIDEAIVISSHTHVIVDGCKIKQNDEVFDNVFRGSNTVVNPDDPYGYPLDAGEICDVKIEGRGGARLVGTDVPRVGYHPVLCENQAMTGDFWGWRTLMISFVFAEDVEISGLELTQTMCWAISFEYSTRVYVHDLAIHSNVKNGDGIDFRSGCHHCTVENISGYTSDDTIACSALSSGLRGKYPYKNYLYPTSPASAFANGRSGDIHDIEIKNIRTGGLHHGVICLAARGNQVYNVTISDFEETAIGSRASTVKIYTGYGDGYTAGDIHDIKVNNIHSKQARYAVELGADVRNVELNGIVQDNAKGSQIYVYPNQD